MGMASMTHSAAGDGFMSIHTVASIAAMQHHTCVGNANTRFIWFISGNQLQADSTSDHRSRTHLVATLSTIAVNLASTLVIQLQGSRAACSHATEDTLHRETCFVGTTVTCMQPKGAMQCMW